MDLLSQHKYVISSIKKRRVKLLINLHTSTLQQLKFGKGEVLSPNVLLGM